MDVGKSVIRVAVVTCMPRFGGGSYQYGLGILNALQRLDTKKYTVSLWFPQEDDYNDFEKYAFEKHHITYKKLWQRIALRLCRIADRLVKTSSYEYLWRQKFLFAPIENWKPHVCIRLEQGYVPLGKNVKIIGPIHDLMHRYEARFPEVGNSREVVTREFLFSRHANTASAILVDSETGRQHVQECYSTPAERIFVLPFCTGHLQDIEPQRPQNFCLSKDQLFLFYPAQMWLHKNHGNLLQAVALLRNAVDIHCVFTGSTDKSGFQVYEQTLRELHLHDKVHHLGYVSDAENIWLYQNAHCLIMPTYFGPTNIPPLEAMQFGCPMAVSQIYGMPEQLQDAALYFDPSSPKDIANTLILLWTDWNKRRELCQKGYERLKDFSVAKFEQRFLNILKNIVAQ